MYVPVAPRKGATGTYTLQVGRNYVPVSGCTTFYGVTQPKVLSPACTKALLYPRGRKSFCKRRGSYSAELSWPSAKSKACAKAGRRREQILAP